MIRILQMTPEQITLYERIRGKFLDMDCTFYGGGRTFGWYGKIDLTNNGEVAVQDLAIACSREHRKGELAEEISRLHQSIYRASWAISTETDNITGGSAAGFDIQLTSTPTPYDTIATHLLLGYGNSREFEELHLQERFILAADVSGDPVEDSGHYYPVRESSDPNKAALVPPDELASCLKGRSLVAFTGAGISLSSGIPTFVGAGGLSDQFPLVEAFPGEVATWMIEHPNELTKILGEFHAGFITAQPNAAHLALAQLERNRVLRQTITGNGDLLHERAGSQKVHYKGANHFVDSNKGWNWIRQGNALLIIGVARDEHGIISYARDNAIQIVVIAPDRPDFLYEGDWFVPGKAEEILPLLATQLTVPRKDNNS